MSKLPKRAASRAQFLFWQMVAFLFMFFGATVLIGGNGAGLILFVGGFGMCLRELGLRRRWKREQRTKAGEAV